MVLEVKVIPSIDLDGICLEKLPHGQSSVTYSDLETPQSI
jgi:hypothetical protein